MTTSRHKSIVLAARSHAVPRIELWQGKCKAADRAAFTAPILGEKLKLQLQERCESGLVRMSDEASAKRRQEPLLNTLGMSAGAAVIAEATTLPFDTAKV